MSRSTLCNSQGEKFSAKVSLCGWEVSDVLIQHKRQPLVVTGLAGIEYRNPSVIKRGQARGRKEGSKWK